MNIQVLENRDVKVDCIYFGSQNENNIEEATIQLPEKYAVFTKKIVFITPNGNFARDIVDNTYTFQNDITQYREIKAYIWCYDSETEEDFRSKTFDIKFFKNENSTDEIVEET